MKPLTKRWQETLTASLQLPAGGHKRFGRFVGASLVPSKLIRAWKVLYDDGKQDKLGFDGADPRKNWPAEMPYLLDYMAYLESEGAMGDRINNTPLDNASGAFNAPKTNYTQQQPETNHAQAPNDGVVIGAGYYEFGSNFPEGVFNLEYLAEKGTLQLKDKDGWLCDVGFGEPGGAASYYGLSSSEYKSFKLNGGVRLRASRAGMINI